MQKFHGNPALHSISGRRFSSLGMSLLIYILKLFNGVMGINLCRSQAGMAQQFFYCINISALVHQVSSESVSQNMRTLFPAVVISDKYFLTIL